MEYFIILLLILLNGFFSMSEIAVVSSRKIRLEAAAKRGKKGAAAALDLANSPSRFLSTVQIGITVIGLFTGIYSGENITNQLEDQLSRFPLFQPIADGLSVTIVLIITTFLTLILGELVPKRIGLNNPEGISSAVASSMKKLSAVSRPIVWLLTRTSDLVIRLLNIRPKENASITEEDIKAVIEEATEGGEIQEIEQDIVERVFLLGDRKISSLMTPRSDTVMISVNDDAATVRRIVQTNLHRFYPVYENDRDNVIGVLTLKDLFLAAESKNFNLRELIRPPHFVLEGNSAYEVLEKFRELKENYGLVITEAGAFRGIVTMDDILLALVGNASGFREEKYEMKQLGDDSWLVDGQYPLIEFMHNLHLEIDDVYGRITTVAGLVLHLLQHVPTTGEKVQWNNMTLEVVDMDNMRIDKIAVRTVDE